MTVQPLTLNVPESLYQCLKDRAEQARRTVEDETLDVLAATLPVHDRLSDDLEEAVAPLELLDDEALWRAARSRLAEVASTQLEELHLKRQRQGLTDAEMQTLSALVRQFERAMLVRARAAGLLKQRGHDVTSLLGPG
jgi:plasmid stability protein